MLSFLKKKINKNIYAPTAGRCIDITDVSDKTFANKLLGDGVAFEPNGNVICAPCDGVITMLFPSKHAFGIKMNDGKEILVHIGIDTVQLNGEGFTSLETVNSRVKAGDPIIQFDRDFIESKQYCLTTMVVITDTNGDSVKKENIGNQVQCKDLVMSC